MDRKIIIGAFLGFGAGVIAGWFFAKNHIEAELEEMYQEEIAQVKADLEEKYGEKKPVEKKSNVVKAPLVNKASYEEGFTAEQKEKHQKLATNYNKPDLATMARANQEQEVRDSLAKAYNGDINPDEEDEDYDEDDQEYSEEAEFRARQLDRMNNKEPYVISYEQKTDEMPEYDKIDLYYYRFDDTLCDDGDTELVDEERDDAVGYDCFEILEKKSSVCVRNEYLRIDYEIHALSSSFVEAVQSLAETPKEAEFRRKGRRKAAMDHEESQM